MIVCRIDWEIEKIMDNIIEWLMVQSMIEQIIKWLND